MASLDNRVVTIKEIEEHQHTILNIQMEEAGREGFCIEIMNCLRCRCLWWWVRCERDKNYFDAVKDQDIERYLNEVEIEGITKEQDEEIMKIKQRQVRVPNKRTQDISDD